MRHAARLMTQDVRPCGGSGPLQAQDKNLCIMQAFDCWLWSPADLAPDLVKSPKNKSVCPSVRYWSMVYLHTLWFICTHCGLFAHTGHMACVQVGWMLQASALAVLQFLKRCTSKG